MKVVRFIDRTTDIILEIILIAALLVGVYSLWDSKQVYETADASNYSAYRPSADDALSFEELRQINPEVFAWLTVNDTPIDYPVAQTNNNEKYINTSAEGEFTSSGCIFLDYRNSPHFDDFNSIIYGHHMEQKMMFGSLSDFADSAYFDAHPYGNLYFDGENHGLEFFALVLTDAYDDDLLSPCAEGEGQRQKYLDHLLEKASLKRDISVSDKDQIVLLSTCTDEITNGRYVLAGKLSSRLHLQEESTEAAKPVIRHLGVPAEYAGYLTSVPVWLWIALTAVLIAMLLVSGKRKDQNNKESKG